MFSKAILVVHWQWETLLLVLYHEAVAVVVQIYQEFILALLITDPGSFKLYETFLLSEMHALIDFHTII